MLFQFSRLTKVFLETGLKFVAFSERSSPFGVKFARTFQKTFSRPLSQGPQQNYSLDVRSDKKMMPGLNFNIRQPYFLAVIKAENERRKAAFGVLPKTVRGLRSCFRVDK